MTTKTDEQLRAEFEAWYQHQPPRNAGELLTDDGILALVRSYDPKFDSDPEGPTESYVIGLVRAALAQKQREKHDTTLFCDLKTDEEKSAFFLSGRGYETGVIARAIQNDVALAYHRCAEYEKEIEALQHSCKEPSHDRVDAERYRWLRENWFTMGSTYKDDQIQFYINGPRYSNATEAELDAAIDHARRVEGVGNE